MANATPSKTACTMSDRLVSIVMPVKVPRAFVSLMGLRSPMRYGRKYTWLSPSFSSEISFCSPAKSDVLKISSHSHLLQLAAESIQPIR